MCNLGLRPSPLCAKILLNPINDFSVMGFRPGGLSYSGFDHISLASSYWLAYTNRISAFRLKTLRLPFVLHTWRRQNTCCDGINFTAHHSQFHHSIAENPVLRDFYPTVKLGEGVKLRVARFTTLYHREPVAGMPGQYAFRFRKNMILIQLKLTSNS